MRGLGQNCPARTSAQIALAAILAALPAAGSARLAAQEETFRQVETEIISDDFPLPAIEHLLPGYRTTAPPKALPDKKSGKPFEVSTRISAQEHGKGLWDKVQTLFADRSWVNILILVGLAAVFVIYRVRGGKRR